MQIVIDIPKEMMSYINENEFNAISEAAYGSMAMLAIQNGTPLPQGHGGLVDYEELENNAREYGAYAEAILSHIKSKTIIDADRKCKEQTEGSVKG